ncbi:MAG: caspase family protein [Pleurocapsa sp.]
MAHMRLDRRTFLQQAGLALFTWGATEVGISSVEGNQRLAPLIRNYVETLAAPTNRKLALLVGVNQYPRHNRLHGCLTDLELQKELLVNRFGFNPQDILLLSDRQATRENIETAFIEHLNEQAQADDVVVFHFSGYGGQIKMPLSLDGATPTESTQPYQLVNSLMPVDSVLSSKEELTVNNILQDTLLLLVQSLTTNKSTIILDTSFNNTPQVRSGNFQIRSVAEVAETVSPQELAFAEQLRLKLAAKGLKPTKRLLSIPGVILSAAGKNQVAAEGQWDGFSAGLFTYALTQYLWQITASSKIQVALQRTAETVEQVMGRQQQPSINSPEKPSIAYYLTTSDAPSAEGVVSSVSGNSLEIKLLGVPASIVQCYGVNSCFSFIADSGTLANTLLQIKSRDGLIVKGQLINQTTETDPKIEVGQLVREKIRILEQNLGLNMALNTNLERIERVDATSALANIKGIASVVLAGERGVDYLLGKVENKVSQPPETNNSEAETEKSVVSYGLFSAGGVLIPKTMGTEHEAVKSAINRLTPQFDRLLAAKWLELITNEFSSALKVNTTLNLLDQNNFAALQRATLASAIPTEISSKNLSPIEALTSLPVLVRGAEIELSLANFGDRDLFALLLGIDADSNIFALYTPLRSTENESEAQLTNIAIASESQLVIPDAENSWKWKVSNSAGINNLYTIFATQPFTNTLTVLASGQNVKLDRQQVLNVPYPMKVIKAVLQDLHAASAVDSTIVGSNTDTYALDVNHWAALNFVYEVVNG